MNLHARCLVAAVVCLTVLPAAAKDIAVTVENVSGADRPAGPVTFGVIFAPGDAKWPAIEAKGLPTQSDIKRHWPDGSIKHAVLTVALPAMPKDGRLKLEFGPGRLVKDNKPPDFRGDLADLADVQVLFQIHNGPAESVSLRQTVATTQPQRTVWLAGSLVREWHFRAAPVSEKGTPDPDLEVRFEVRYYPAAKSARVAVIVENCRWTTPGNIPYDVRILVAGREVYARKEAGRFDVDGNNSPLTQPERYIGHAAGARWVKRLWVGATGAGATGAGDGPARNGPARALDDVHVRYDVAYWATTGLLPRYDPSLAVPEATLAKMAARWDKSSRDILQNGFILPYFPATGGREDLGPLPTWTARYVVSQDGRALRVVLGNADLGAGCPVHHRDGRTDWTISIDDHPTYSLNPAGSLFRVKPRDAHDTPWVMPPNSRFAVDCAHQASLAYVPYLVTGEFFYLEEVQFWANWNLLIGNQGYRSRDKGILTCSLQPRGVAWALRQLIHAAAITPDDGREKAHADYFAAKLANNLQFYKDFLEGRLDIKPVPIGTFPPAAGAAYGDTPQIRDKFRTTAGWMHNFLAWSFIHAVEQGYADAVPARDYFVKLCIGAFTHPDEIPPFAGTAYFLVLAEKGDDGQLRFYQTWREVGEGLGRMGARPPTAVSYPGYGGSYSYIARGILIESVRAKLPGAADALKWLDAQLPDRQKVLADDPTWAFEPAGPREQPK